MSHSSVCWRCGSSLAALSLPFSRFDTCKAGGADLHACKQCLFYQVTVAKQCREPVADEVRDKQRANVCDYFSVRADAYQPATEQASTQSQLAALFGAVSESRPVTNDTVSDQIKNKADTAAAARAALEELFGRK